MPEPRTTAARCVATPHLGDVHEVAVHRAQHRLVRDDAHALPLPLHLDHDGLDALDDVQVRLAARVPATGM